MMTGLKDINWVERRLFYGDGVPEGHIGPPERYWPEGFSAVLKRFIAYIISWIIWQNNTVFIKKYKLKNPENWLNK